MKTKTKIKAGAGTCSNEKYESMLDKCKNTDGSYDLVCAGEVYDHCGM